MRSLFWRGSFVFFLVLFVSVGVSEIIAQRRPARTKAVVVKKFQAFPAIVVDEYFSVLRFEPALSAIALQRMRSGRELTVTGEKMSDGVKFYRVQMPSEKSGWVQAEAVVSPRRSGDDERLTRLIRVASGFDQIERAAIFLDNFPASPLRPAVLLLAGDLCEDAAAKLSRDAARKFDADEIAASGAPVHSFYLNFSGLDRYKRIGMDFVFARSAKQFHYDGAAWRELIKKFPNSTEAAEARKRLESLTAAMK